MLRYSFVLVALINGALLCATILHTFTVSPTRTYTWRNRDYPIELPVGQIPTVEMTFQESARFGLSDPDSKKNWGVLFNTNSFGLGVQHLGTYHFRYVSSAYHALHCLYTMQLDFDKPNHVKEPSSHFVHCMSYLRQIFTCNADMTLEDGDFMRRNLTTDRVSDTRKCRDWRTVKEWVNQNNNEWFVYNNITVE
ncbi:hypothetical protein E1B28_000718 [Marasmius oreades]|uniref:Oxidase ustYa n=1 Tax=Marasmius oreades TaxID=181124 RepID=A0A9P7V1W2_9AGAR|nr:uncharacterized protein E1B28_000718 [Marasmius oreades]KAG7098813.1 hypothetical protein E1B28_000718 [Marasmius oreades]